MKRAEYEKQVTKALELYEKAGIILSEAEKKNIEVCDHGIGIVEKVGLQLVTYINTRRVCAKEMVLTPGQTCPEHKHVPTDGDLALYAVNDTLVPRTAEYTVTAYDKACSKAVIANGSCAQDANSSGIIADLKLPAEPQLLIIRWSDGRGEYVNHAFTGKAEYEVMKNWIKIIADEFSLGDELLELS